MAMKIITGYTGEKHITSADDAMLYKALFGNEDYVLPTGSQLAATIQSATEIRIAEGELIMQGRFARNVSRYEAISINNGSQGMSRNDLIVARYTKDANTAVESIILAVITGTAAAGTAVDPAYNTGDIDNGETRDFPLYRVRLNGINIDGVDQLFEVSALTKSRTGLNAYPVGAVYISYEKTSPAELFGGTWTPITGVFPYFNAGTGTGGSNTHTLTITEMPSHNHSATIELTSDKLASGSTYSRVNNGGTEYSNMVNIANTGGGGSHNNMPAYQTFYAWRRTA